MEAVAIHSKNISYIYPTDAVCHKYFPVLEEAAAKLIAIRNQHIMGELIKGNG